MIGTGKIGTVFAKIMQGFGAEVSAYDPFPKEELTKLGIQYKPLKTILNESRVLSLHLPLTKESKHIINSDSISEMKEGVFLINTSRGGLIETNALIKGLKSGIIGAVGLDVYEEEEGIFFIDHSSDLITDDKLARLLTFPNALITSHQAFLTSNALQNIADTTIGTLNEFKGGKKLTFEII